MITEAEVPYDVIGEILMYAVIYVRLLQNFHLNQKRYYIETHQSTYVVALVHQGNSCGTLLESVVATSSCNSAITLFGSS